MAARRQSAAFTDKIRAGVNVTNLLGEPRRVLFSVRARYEAEPNRGSGVLHA